MTNDPSRKLHLGCFDIVVPGWINTDITPHIWIARVPGLAWALFKVGMLPQLRYRQHQRGVFRQVHYLDVTKRFPFAGGTIDYVYASHLLEHLYPDRAAFCLKEVYRVLRTGGLARIAVPDLDAYMTTYRPEQADAFLERFFETKQKRGKNSHHWQYNEFTLTRLIRGVGFEHLNRCEFQQGRCPDLNSIENRPGSLIMEAVKS